MKVFKTCFLITWRTRATYLIYLLIFCLLALALGQFSSDNRTMDFSESHPNISLINRDEDSPLIRGLSGFLEQKGNLVPLTDSQEELQDSLFFHKTDYILIIPRGFLSSLTEETPLELEKIVFPQSTEESYITSLVNQYWNLVKSYKLLLPGLSEEEQAEAVLQDLSVSSEVTRVSFGTSGTLSNTYASYGYMLAYILMVLIMLCVSNVFLAFQKPDITMRNLCTPLKPLKLHLELSSYGAIISVLCWFLLTVSGLLFYRPWNQGTDIRLLLLLNLNSLAYTFVAFGSAMFFTSFIKNLNTQSILSNFVSLIYCFLGGIFVPLELLGENLLKISRFTPTFWYVTAIDKIMAVSDFTPETLMPTFQAMGLQCLFGLAFLSASLAVYKHQFHSRESYGSVKSEVSL